MGNRGTTPNWDDEQIAIYGFLEFMDSVSAPFRAREAERKSALVSEYMDDTLSALGNSGEEERARLSFAIPHAIGYLQIGNTAISDWQKVLANLIYINWRSRTNPAPPLREFKSLTEEEAQPFFEVIEAITQVWQSRNTPKP